jgi:hypothetical protein
MATRIIPPAPGTNGRARKVSTPRDVINLVPGPTRSYGPCPLTTPANQMVVTGGSSMSVLLGPDLGDGLRRGTPTSSAVSLQPLMGLLHANSVKTWKAGHLLNAELGGSGTADDNLTPLTASANSAHSTFEGHIVRMLNVCHQLDYRDASAPSWYGVLYTVTVSLVRYAAAPSANDMHSYVYSHLALDYRFVLLPKFPAVGAPHASVPPPNISNPVSFLPPDPNLAALQSVVRPNFAPSVNIANWTANPNGIQFSVEIHNEP